MFGILVSCGGGNIPADSIYKIEKASNVFMKQTKKLVNNGFCNRSIVRLLKPCNICVILDDSFIHFIFTNKGTGGIADIQHADFRGHGACNFEQAVKVVERDLYFEDCFGFTIESSKILDTMLTDDEMIIYVKKYLTSEIMVSERELKIVRINPIFKGRDFYVEDNSCFVLMPFTTEYHLKEVYEDNIQTTVHNCGMTCLRADDILNNDAIIEDIWGQINKAKVIIADLTGKNPNVFYELGIAHTIGKEVIMISQNIDDVPFDLRYLRVIVYETTQRGTKFLQAQLTDTINIVRTK